ncbi:hypothetical protein TREMEDRAFT_64424 [Tremella mesenterica DSM 1558]|uniref:uncharacterized protein n=1 Tax=Tremella mesenterica (strain ATCC 24925 / CBS 8224 / DSM 1558 / NBRC 9311 / NRRL Y-6157 / RJB 2259-6 / UBC 559-6) TaxID=578456 RepID=UPI0003F4A30B|nr:uncharacterized protein TREMEDRAFT_64424 [Tremella mesenterica DSM 1558]EIW67184.1 hypothetical protein TREMEDRAFT_64424 [Tremella mesenterica DSM 1558]
MNTDTEGTPFEWQTDQGDPSESGPHFPKCPSSIVLEKFIGAVMSKAKTRDAILSVASALGKQIAAVRINSGTRVPFADAVLHTIALSFEEHMKTRISSLSPLIQSGSMDGIGSNQVVAPSITVYASSPNVSPASTLVAIDDGSRPPSRQGEDSPDQDQYHDEA